MPPRAAERSSWWWASATGPERWMLAFSTGWTPWSRHSRPADLVLVRGHVTHFQGRPQILLEQVDRLDPEPIDPAEFEVPPPPPGAHAARALGPGRGRRAGPAPVRPRDAAPHRGRRPRRRPDPRAGRARGRSPREGAAPRLSRRSGRRPAASHGASDDRERQLERDDHRRRDGLRRPQCRDYVAEMLHPEEVQVTQVLAVAAEAPGEADDDPGDASRRRGRRSSA